MEAELYEGVIALTRSALKNQAALLPAGFSVEAALPMIRQHNLDNIALEGAVKSGISMDAPGMKELLGLSAKCLVAVQRQQAAIRALLNTFVENGIDHLPLKGMVLRELYPQPEFRTMGDADILIREEQYEKVVPLMTGLGYTNTGYHDHDYTWEGKYLTVEIHVRFVPRTEGMLADYYRDPWRFPRPTAQPFRYEMSPEDTFIFLFVHMTKHYRGRGVGIRQLIDLWVYKESVPPMDQEYLQSEFDKLGLYRFYLNIMDTLNVWMDGGAHTETTRIITEHIVSGGVFGLQERRELTDAMRMSDAGDKKFGVKIKLFWQSVFPEFSVMRRLYPVLDDSKWLLPICYVARWLRLLFKTPDKISRKVKNLNSVSNEKLDAQRQMLESVGLGVQWLAEDE